MKEIIHEITEYMQIIETFDKDAGQDGQALHSYLINLTNILARANFLMAEYHRKFREEKIIAYKELTESVIKFQRYWAPSLAKDWVDARCSETGYVYDLAERLSRLCVHAIDAIRTVVSSLKSERIFSNTYQ